MPSPCLVRNGEEGEEEKEEALEINLSRMSGTTLPRPELPAEPSREAVPLEMLNSIISPGQDIRHNREQRRAVDPLAGE